MIKYDSYLGQYGYGHDGSDDSKIKYLVKNVPDGFFASSWLILSTAFVLKFISLIILIKFVVI